MWILGCPKRLEVLQISHPSLGSFEDCRSLEISGANGKPFIIDNCQGKGLVHVNLDGYLSCGIVTGRGDKLMNIFLKPISCIDWGIIKIKFECHMFLPIIHFSLFVVGQWLYQSPCYK